MNSTSDDEPLDYGLIADIPKVKELFESAIPLGVLFFTDIPRESRPQDLAASRRPADAIQKAEQILEQIEERCGKNEATQTLARLLACDGCGRRVKSEVELLAHLYSHPASSKYSSLGRSSS